jgi:chaperonin GroEL (HSP60 family)
MAIIEMVALMAPNIDTIRYTANNATKTNEQEEFNKVKEAIENAAGTGAEEVVFTEELDDLYIQILKDAGYYVYKGTYNTTSKKCTLVEWRTQTKWQVDAQGAIVART